MKRGYFSLPGVIMFIVIAIIYIAMFPAFESIINIALPAADPTTQVLIAAIPAVILVGLLVGYYRSVINPQSDYK